MLRYKLFWRVTLKLNNIKEMAPFEHHFWLQILGDHSRFILNALKMGKTSVEKDIHLHFYT